MTSTRSGNSRFAAKPAPPTGTEVDQAMMIVWSASDTETAVTSGCNDGGGRSGKASTVRPMVAGPKGLRQSGFGAVAGRSS
jgi:hypothetical protein